ncbi:MAG: DUF3160 domain-containing protein [Lachnospiraceae bacterium]|nr:DUF3160 domain-containing protein [Lachnospiraceae bacterium]
MNDKSFLERRDEELLRKSDGPKPSEKRKKVLKVVKWLSVAICVCLLVGGIVWTIKSGARRGGVSGDDVPAGEAVAQNATEATAADATEAKTEPMTEAKTAPDPETEPATEAKAEEVTEPQTEEVTEVSTEPETEVPRPTYSDEEIFAMVSSPNAEKVSVGAVKPKLTTAKYGENGKTYTPSVKPYTVAPDLSNVVNLFYFTEEQKQKLAANGFVVENRQYDEFFEVYEGNRYYYYPNFVTTDSMMHTFHNYYVKLQKTVEKEYLYDALTRLSDGMLKKSLQQYYFFRGTEWEEAAKRNTAFFGVAAKLLGSEVPVPADIDAMITEEVKKIMDASDIYKSVITPENEFGEDYTQYIPRSYYAGDPKLERYFRVMMWYGRMFFAQKNEQGNRCALLMNIALSDESNYNEWYAIYEVTSFLCGASDDLVYNEYIPVIMQVYGADFTLDSLVGNTEAWNRFVEAIKPLRGPKINSTPFVIPTEGDEDWKDYSKGFRFMGQRFVLDAEIFQNLLYNSIWAAEDGDERLLPEALDIPAAFGSDLALDILIEQGHDKYPNYLSTMQEMRQVVGESGLYWTSCVYGGWLNTLRPLLEIKGEGYPSFMTNTEWQKKSLEGFLGSWTELKHDSILYAKQPYSVSEGDGGDYYPTAKDDRGYVEPEPELFDRLSILAEATKAGLKDMGYLSEKDEESLDRLAELSRRLRDIAIKELEEKALTEDDYELIRFFGGTIEHFWLDANEDSAYFEEVYDDYEWYLKFCEEYGEECEYDTIEEFIDGCYGQNNWEVDSMAIVADVATDTTNGLCLEEAIGGASEIFVVFPIDGELHVASGAVYTQYQFTRDIDKRMTDKEWQDQFEYRWVEYDENGYGGYFPPNNPEHPEWTNSYRTGEK